jgi:hypothetical protein
VEKKDKIEKQANRRNKLKLLHTQKFKKISQKLIKIYKKKRNGKLFLKTSTSQIPDFSIKNDYWFFIGKYRERKIKHTS